MSQDSAPEAPSKSLFGNLRYDLPSGIVVFVVALPLCLGIAFASGNIDGQQLVPPLAGIVTGIVGGILVAWLSGSHTSVSGPAAGLIVMVVEAVRLYGYAGLLTVTVLAGVFQIVFGLLKFGRFGQLFPDAVVKAMLAAIGIILILKQIPHAIGFDNDYEGDLAFAQVDGLNTLTEIPFAFGHFLQDAYVHLGALAVAGLGIGIILVRENSEWLKSKNWLPGPLLVVVSGVLLNELFHLVFPRMALSGEFLVRLPTGDLDAIGASLASPDWSLLSTPALWVTALGIAIVASLETLLCADAVDGIDPFKRKTPPSRELLAQGVGNTVAGMLGGIPMTAVVVRGSANVQSGARSRVSSFLHGCLLLFAVVTGAKLMNRVPLAALAAILLHIGYRLANPKSLRKMMKRAPDHWVPFFATIAAILFTDLLTGIALGFMLSVVFIVARTRRVPATKSLRLGPIVPPLSRFLLRRSLAAVESGTVVVDAVDSDPIDPETREALAQLREESAERGLQLELLNVDVEAA